MGSLRPDGKNRRWEKIEDRKKKLTYTIYIATKLGPAKPQLDSNLYRLSSLEPANVFAGNGPRLNLYREMSSWKTTNGAIEGTRTPTPLPVHGPEPCASANSATMAILDCNAAAAARPPSQEDQRPYFTAPLPPVKHRR